MKTSEQTNELAAALSLAQGEMTNAALSAVNPHFKSAYSKLDDVWDACRTPLSKHNLAVIQGTEYNEGRVVITTRLEHKSGQWYESALSLKAAQDTPHAFGSAITYGRRYSLMAIVGIAPGETDDDGNHASGSKLKDSPPQQPKGIPKEALTQDETFVCAEEINHANSLDELQTIWVKWYPRIKISTEEIIKSLTVHKDETKNVILKKSAKEEN